MSVPSGFSNSKEYFKKCLDFLQRYSWIYESSNTCFLRDNIFENFPCEWVEYFTTVSNEHLNAFPFRKLQTNRTTLDEFVSELDLLIPQRINFDIPSTENSFKKMSLKKQHEISKLSALIQSISTEKIDILIDFGSGLGYLSELLYKSNAYQILGIESDASRVRTAIERQETIYPASKKNVAFKEHFVRNESKDFILAEVQKLAPQLEKPRLAIIGLHSCADLTVNSMKLFFAIDNVKQLIIMPCCYHKLEVENGLNKIGFKNFPLSQVLREIYVNKGDFDGLNRPFLRLACQQTSARWKNLSEEQHYEHSIGMFFRGVAEAILGEDERVIKTNSKETIRDLDFSELSRIYELQSISTKKRLCWTSEHEYRFAKLMQEHPAGPRLSEGLTCLQEAMQELCENIVLYDRICYMEEQAVNNNLNLSVKFEKIMDELLSPRRYVLIAQKL